MKTARKIFLSLLAAVVAILVVQVIRAGKASPPPPEISYSSFLSRVVEGQVSKVVITGIDVLGYETKGGAFRVIAPPNQSAMLDVLQQHGVEVWFRDASGRSWPYWLLNCTPLILMIVLWILLVRRRGSQP
jgi:ATP-dependent Zn protease